MNYSRVFDFAFEQLMWKEGGFNNFRSDPGGATNWGVSLRWLKTKGALGDLDHDGDVDVDDIKIMSRDQAKDFFYTDFWVVTNIFRIQSPLIVVKVFDTAVNIGPRMAVEILQRSANDLGSNLEGDGRLGKLTWEAVNCYAKTDYKLLAKLRERQALYYEDLVAHKASFEEFHLGWLRRAAS